MTETVDIVTFLRARLDEDQSIAEAATAGPWEVDDEQYAEQIRAADGASPVAGSRWGGEASVFESTEDAVHIARHDPARVLADVVARRAILAQHHRVEWSGPAGCGTCSTEGVELVLWPCLTVRALAVPYAGHPDHYSGWGLDGTS